MTRNQLCSYILSLENEVETFADMLKKRDCGTIPLPTARIHLAQVRDERRRAMARLKRMNVQHLQPAYHI